VNGTIHERFFIMRTQNAVLIVGALLLTGVLTPAVRAHHAFAAEFDATKPVRLDKAVVAKVDWVNPHTWIHVDVARPDGTKERWAIEAGTPNVLFRRGFNKQSLLVGTVINIDGYRAKDGSRRANGRDLTLPNGQTLFLGSSGTGAPADR
jgi:hypothetical protein